MLIVEQNRMSQLAACLDAAPNFLLSKQKANGLIRRQVQLIRKHWRDLCEEAQLSKMERAFFWKRQFLNPYCFENTPIKF